MNTKKTCLRKFYFVNCQLGNFGQDNYPKPLPLRLGSYHISPTNFGRIRVYEFHETFDLEGA